MKKTIFLPILVFLIFVVVLYGLIPFLSKAGSLSAENKKQAADLEQTKNYFINLRAISEQLNQNQEILTNIERALPNEVSVPSLMNFFQITAAESGLLLRNFNYEEAINQGDAANQTAVTTSTLNSRIKSAVFHLTVEGNLASFVDFMKNLEVSSRLLEVGLINFQISDKAQTQFSIAVKAHSY